MSNRSLAVLALLAAGCAPDPLLGSYAFTIVSGQDNQTAPSTSSSTPTGTGTLCITKGKTDDYLVTLAHADVGGCTLRGTRNKDDALKLELVANQNCVLKNNNTQVNAVITNGTAALTITQVSQSVQNKSISLPVSYSYSGTTVFGINFAGTGARTYAGPEM